MTSPRRGLKLDNAKLSPDKTLSDIFRENSRKVITRLAICRENFH